MQWHIGIISRIPRVIQFLRRMKMMYMYIYVVRETARIEISVKHGSDNLKRSIILKWGEELNLMEHDDSDAQQKYIQPNWKYKALDWIILYFLNRTHTILRCVHDHGLEESRTEHKVSQSVSQQASPTLNEAYFMLSPHKRSTSLNFFP